MIQIESLDESYLNARLSYSAKDHLIALPSNELLSRLNSESSFYIALKNKIAQVTPEQIIEREPENYASTPFIEVKLYVMTAKDIAMNMLKLLLQGALLAVDTDLIHPKIYKDKGALKHAAQSFVDEVKGTYNPFLKFDEVQTGIEHLEQIIEKM